MPDPLQSQHIETTALCPTIAGFLGKCRQKFFNLREPICQRIPLLGSEQQAFKASVLK